MRVAAINRVVRVVGAGAVLLAMVSGCRGGEDDESTAQPTTSVTAAVPAAPRPSP